ncbi:MAG: TlpA family protein disulfide reductase [Polyangiaceae bacterium]|nr:TlpA family protein disulfide reductase [Polyangiaceae bacterium]
MRSALASLVLWLTACTATGGEPRAAGAPARAPPPEPEPESAPFRVLSPAERVPDFRVASTDRRWFESRSWVGKEPFVVVFFATWCRVCELKLPLVSQALAHHPNLPVLLVSLDDADTWDGVPRFLRRFGLAHPVVRGTSFPRFSLAYDPLETVPAVAVVGRNGHLVDYQVGYSASHGPRLAAAVELAVRMPPDAPPFLGSPDRARPESRDPDAGPPDL